MKSLNKAATKVFMTLIRELAVGEGKKIGDGKVFMAVHVDRLGENTYAIAHRYEQNGDLVPDPDMEFVVVSGCVVPTAIDQAYGYRRAVEHEDGQNIRFNPRAQRELAAFANTWMKNIRLQQEI
jgi:hypothetical protein